MEHLGFYCDLDSLRCNSWPLDLKVLAELSSDVLINDIIRSNSIPRQLQYSGYDVFLRCKSTFHMTDQSYTYNIYAQHSSVRQCPPVHHLVLLAIPLALYKHPNHNPSSS
jgi:hypothetical protein